MSKFHMLNDAFMAIMALKGVVHYYQLRKLRRQVRRLREAVQRWGTV